MGLSRAALAQSAEQGFPISEVTIRRAENGKRIRLNTASTLARMLSVPLTALLPDHPGDGPTAGGAVPELGSGAPPGTSLVNRRRELDAFDAALRRARKARPSVLLLRGDPGIGKTQLLRELRVRVEDLGGLCCSGQGHEDAGFPLQPIIDALAPKADELARGASPEAELVRDFAMAGPAWAARAGRREDDEKDHALYRAIASTLLAASPPASLVLDDLHWCDRGSLDLFEYLASAVCQAADRGERSGLVLVASYRPDELPERLHSVLSRLSREPACQTLSLEGLNETDSFELIRQLGIRRPSQQLVAALHESTQGNPLFLQEVLRLLRVRGELHERGGFLVTRTTGQDLELPRSLGAAISTRAKQLSPECRRALERGAFLGVRFGLEKLAVALADEEEKVLDALEKAVTQEFLRNRGQTFEFVHPLVRQILYREPIPARAQRFHREIAERLSAWYGADAEQHACEIADHLLRAGPVARTESVMRFTRLAAQRSLESFDWDAAARFTEATLSVGHERGELSDRERAELHHQAGIALHRSWDVGPCLAHYDAAVAAFERASDLGGLAGALNDRVRLADNLGIVSSTLPQLKALETALERLGDSEAPLRGQILDTLATCHFMLDPARARALAEAALGLGLEIGDDDLCAQVSTSLALAHLQQLELDDALDRWRQGCDFARRAEDQIREVRCLQRQPLVLAMLGRCAEADRVATEAWELSETIQSPGEASLPRAVQTGLAVLRGEFARAEELASETLGMLHRWRYIWAGPIVGPALACARGLRGAWPEARETLDRMLEPGEVFDEPARFEAPTRRFRRLIDAWASTAPGSPQPERAECVRDARAAPPPGDSVEMIRIAEFCVEVELADMLELPELAERSFEPLRAAHACGVIVPLGWVSLVPRVLGVAARLLGRNDEATLYFEAALRWARREGARAEHARVRLDYARLLRGRDDDAALERAGTLGRRAREDFASLRMWPFAERAQALLDSL